MKTILAIIFFLSVLTSTSQVIGSTYPYHKAEWTYVQRWENWFVSNPPYVYYSFLVCKLNGDTVWNGKQYNKITANGYAGFQYMRKSHDSLFTGLLSQSDSTDYLSFNFAADIGDSINGESGEVNQVWTDTLMNGEVKRVLAYANQSNDPDTVIEDLGQVNRPVFEIAYTNDAPVWSRLVCFKKDSNQVLYYLPFSFTDTTGTYVNPCSSQVASVGATNVAMALGVHHDMMGNVLVVYVPKEVQGIPFSIMDLTGKTVQSVTLTGGKNYISTSSLSGGLYLYSTSKGDYFRAGKFIVR